MASYPMSSGASSAAPISSDGGRVIDRKSDYGLNEGGNSVTVVSGGYADGTKMGDPDTERSFKHR